MERIRALIDKLHDQSQQHADVSAMMVTLQMLQAEMVHFSSSAPKQLGTAKVAVVMPSNKIPGAYKEPVREAIKEPADTPPLLEKIQEVAVTSKVPDKTKMPEVLKSDEHFGWLFDPVQEIPTLAHQKEFKEMNDVFGEAGTSLNDKLKTEKKELASVLHEAPVRDLKKAIGVNDRFLFLSELFRGDETMYERSIKTINNFRIYPEAEYWIERELKVKLGWDENKEVVRQFQKLVKRRFS